MLVVIAAVNFLINPYAQYPTNFVEPLVQTSRAQKVQLLQDCTTPPDGLILGSSRVLKFEPEHLHKQLGVSFFNAGMNHAKPEDFLAYLRFFRTTLAKAPEVIVIGLDVNTFTDAVPPDARLVNQPELSSLVPEAISIPNRMKRWSELIGWQQTRMSLASLKRHLRPGPGTDPVESFRPDGLIVYHEREQQLADNNYDFESALAYNVDEYENLIGQFSFSNQRRELFETLVRECAEANSRLFVFLTPLHPELRHHLLETTNYLSHREEVATWLSEIALANQFVFRDFSVLESFAGNPTQFVDGIHPLESNTRLMIDQLVETTGAHHAVQ